MKQDTVSTGQAAKLCGVKPDTILKWVKKSKIEAFQTAGGHYRISKDNLKPYLVKDFKVSVDEAKRINYCWEYHSENDTTDENCRECIIFRSKAEKCYLMAGLGKNIGYAQTYCKDSCYECEYFQFTNQSPINVLIVTENKLLERRLKANVDEKFMLKFTCCGYDTSLALQEFHPDYIIIDKYLVKSSAEEICTHLLKDPRAQGSQIVITMKKDQGAEKLPDGICATIPSPLYIADMEKCFQTLHEHFLGKNPEIKETVQ